MGLVINNTKSLYQQLHSYNGASNGCITMVSDDRLHPLKGTKEDVKQILLDKESTYIMRCPYRYKYELVDWATKRWPSRASKFKSMKKSQLYAIWYSS